MLVKFVEKNKENVCVQLPAVSSPSLAKKRLVTTSNVKLTQNLI